MLNEQRATEQDIMNHLRRGALGKPDIMFTSEARKLLLLKTDDTHLHTHFTCRMQQNLSTTIALMQTLIGISIVPFPVWKQVGQDKSDAEGSHRGADAIKWYR